MLPINGFIIVSLIICAAFFFGLITFLNDYEENKCEMTYMFEYPQFVRVSNEADEHYEKYALYAYSEGALTYKAREMCFDGMPVLFIPGNAGSYKQVRSLASISLRKSLNSRPGFHFNYFTVDLNDELSGLNGALLYQQVDYVNKSIRTILQLYENRYNSPKSIVLVGHSMGGIIATKILGSLPGNSNLIPIVVTLATPHVRAPVVLDSYMNEFYESIGNTLVGRNTTVVSISGGYTDFLVPTGLTTGGNIHVVSTAVPRSWLPVDHLCILWCKQLTLVVNRAIFDSVDIKTKHISSNSSLVEAAFNLHLLKHSGTKVQLASRYSGSMNFYDEKGDWIEPLARQFSVTVNPSEETKLYMIRLVNHPLHEAVTLVGINMGIEWVYACPAVHIKGSSRFCKEGKHLTQLSEIVPSVKYKRRMLKLNLHELSNNYTSATHVVVRIPPTDKPVILHADVYGPGSRKIPVGLPRWWSLHKHVLVKETQEGAIHYNLMMPDLNHIYQSYQLFVEPLKCASLQNHHATASLSVPWGNQRSHAFFTEIEKKPMHLRLYTSRPQEFTNFSAVVTLTLDPSCRYSISIKASVAGTLGHLARYYLPLLIANVVAVMLMTLRCQLMAIHKNERCSLFFTALKEGAKPYYILTIAKLLSRILSSASISKYIPTNDFKILENEGLEFLWLPLILYMCSVGIVWIVAVNLAFSLVVCESTVHKVILRFFAKSVTGTVTWSDWFISNLQKLPLLVASILFMISWSTCGGLALCLGTFFYFLKLTQMSQDIIETLVWRIIKGLGNKLKSALSRKKPITPAEGTSVQNIDNGEIDNVVEDISEKISSSSEKGNPEKENKSDSDEEESDGDGETSDNEDTENKDINKSGQCGESSENKIKNMKKVVIDKGKIEKHQKEKEGSPPKSKSKSETNEQSWISELLEHNEIYFHFTMFLLWTLVALLNVPSVLTWAHNFKYDKALYPDPSFIPGLILSICAMPLWHFEFPRVEKLWYKELSFVVYGAAVLSLIFGTISIYRLNYTIVFVICIVLLHQLLAPSKPQEEASKEEESKDVDPEKTYDNVKAKWE